MFLHQSYQQKYDVLKNDIIDTVKALMNTENASVVDFKESLQIKTPVDQEETYDEFSVIIGLDLNTDSVKIKDPTEDEFDIYLDDLEIHQLIWIMQQLEMGKYEIIEEQEEV